MKNAYVFLLCLFGLNAYCQKNTSNTTKNESSVLKFNTQTLATWDDKKNDWFRDWPHIPCNAIITLAADSTIKLELESSNKKKSFNEFKWVEKKDKNQNGRLWTNYTLFLNKDSEFFMINLEMDTNKKIVDVVLINDKALMIFFNK